MDAGRALHASRERFARDVWQALSQVPQEIADSAVGHAVLAEALIQIAADILKRQDNTDFLSHLVGFIARHDAGNKLAPASNEWSGI